MCNETGKTPNRIEDALRGLERDTRQDAVQGGLSAGGAYIGEDPARLGHSMSDDVRKANSARLEAARQNLNHLHGKREQLEQDRYQVNRAIEFMEAEIQTLQQLRRF